LKLIERWIIEDIEIKVIEVIVVFFIVIILIVKENLLA
jgi:hypothetical protein